jgi:transcriptional regulator with XRE-family HTH domain
MKRKRDARLEKIGKNIKKARKIRNLTVRELGARSSLDYSQIAAVERGEANLRVTSFRSLAVGLEVDPRDLVKFDEEPTFEAVDKEKIIKVNQIAANVKGHREDQKLSYRELGLLSSVDYSQIGAIERGEANLMITTLLKLADGLKVDPAALLAPL